MEKIVPDANTTYYWQKDVIHWSDEELKTWANENLTPDTLPEYYWHQKQLAAWARAALDVPKENANILIEKEIDGLALISTPGFKEILSWGMPLGSAVVLRAAIERMNKKLKLVLIQLPPPSERTVAEIIEKSPKVRAEQFKADLPLTNVGYGGTLAQGVLNWGHTYAPPFMNREDSLLALLRVAFNNWAGINNIPTIVMKAATPGSGKTRLLFEWPARVFSSPEVLEVFRTESGPQEIRERFLNDLWASVHQQRMIVFQCSYELKTVKDDDLLCHIIVQCIKTRFRGCQLKFNNAIVTVNQLPKVQTSAEAVALFNHIINQNYPLPDKFPYELSDYECRPLLLFLGDHMQDLNDEEDDQRKTISEFFRELSPHFTPADSTSIKADMKLTRNHRAHNLLLQIVEFRRHNIKYTAFVTGTLPLNLPDESMTAYKLVDVAMDSLTDLKYLNQMCLELHNCKLHRSIWPASALSNINARELDDGLSFVLRRNYLKCCGQPRAIGDLFRSNTVNKNLTAAKISNDDSQETDLGQVDYDMYMTVCSYYGSEISMLCQVLQYDNPSVQKLLVQAALCWEVNPQDISPIDNRSYAEIAQVRYLIPWKSNGRTAQYTYPFLFYGKNLDNGVKILHPQQTINSEHFQAIKISYQTLLLPQRSIAALYDNTVRKICFEETVAATIYARFRILTDYDCDKSIKLSELMPGTWTGRLANAQVQLRGVVKSKQRLNSNSKEVFAELFYNKYIAVDIGNSEFANVILPVFFEDEPRQFFLAIQAKNGRKESSARVFTNAQKVLHNDNFFYLALLPWPNCEFEAVNLNEISVQVDYNSFNQWQKEHRYLQQTCEQWLSPWFLTLNESLSLI